MSQFFISDTNPNVGVGGGGTLGSGAAANEDATGPFIIFPHTTTDSNVSPHSVISFQEFTEVYKAMCDYQEEPEVIDSTAEEIPSI
jgi:hypothetical protein